MPWPDLFWKSKKPKPVAEVAPEPEPEAPQSAALELQPPTIKPVPATATVAGPAGPTAAPIPASIAVPPPAKVEPKVTPTIAATHGVVLRPPTGRTVTANATTSRILPPRAVNPPKAPEPIKNIEQLMAEADPVRTLRQTGNVRVLAPLSAATPETAPLGPPPAQPPAMKVEPVPRSTTSNTAIPPSPNLMPVPTPTFRPAVTAPFSQPRRIEPTPPRAVAAPTPAPAPIPVPVPLPAATIPTPAPLPPPAEVLEKPVPPPEENDSPFILKSAPPVAAPEAATKILPPTSPSLSPVGSIFRRKARMADVARIVLPPKREDSQQLHPHPPLPTGPTPTVVPPAFPVAAMTARASQHLPTPVTPEPPKDAVSEKIVTESVMPPSFEATESDSFILRPGKATSEPVDVVPAGIVGTSNTELPALDQAFDFTPPGHVEPALIISPPLPTTEARPIEPLLHTDAPPKVDPEAHKPATAAVADLKVDPEAHRPRQVEAEPAETKPVEALPVEPVPAPPPAPVAALSSAPAAPEKREFHLANGERVAGTVLSETPEAIYIEHGTLGVITIPRANIAKRLVEIILVNGDRIVGDILAETADTLYVKHASLGMLTVPRAARSTRVVEAILKDGDRILGEVLTETETFTVIRSASLGTITVPHAKLAMLNRKVEQIEMKALPAAAPELKEKASN